MAALEDLKPNSSVRGVLPNAIVTVVSVQWFGSGAIELTYKDATGKVGNELLTLIMHDAWDHLKPGGRFYVVTISGLKEYIRRNFRQIFGNYKKIKQGKTYTVALAVRE